MNSSVDHENSIIRGVSVMTGNVIARGHDLEVDDTTLTQVKLCAERKGKVSVKIDHKSGAGAVCGYLCNFRTEHNQLKADWHLMKSHPQREQILETAERMGSCVGLSAAFSSPEKTERTAKGMKAARCQELHSVDYVAAPAANPGGLFARVDDELIEFSAKRPQDRASIHSVVDATSDQLRKIERPDFPGESTGRFIEHWAKRHPAITSRVASRLGKLGGGIVGGGIVGAKLAGKKGLKAGAAVGGIAGLIFSAKYEKEFMEMNTSIRSGQRETHRDLDSLSRRILLPPAVCSTLIESGALRPVHELSRSDPNGAQIFEADDLNLLRGISLEQAAKKAVDQLVEFGHDPKSQVGTLMVIGAMRDHALSYGDRREDEDDGIGQRIAKGAAVVGGGAALLTGAAYLRGRALRKGGAAVAPGVVSTAKAGFNQFPKDATSLLEKIRAAKLK